MFNVGFWELLRYGYAIASSFSILTPTTMRWLKKSQIDSSELVILTAVVPGATNVTDCCEGVFYGDVLNDHTKVVIFTPWGDHTII